MSTLLVDELFNGVVFEQPIRITKSTQFAYIRAWIYKNGTLASGNLQLQVYDGATLLKTVSIPYADINTNIPLPYAHGYIKFDVSPLALNVNPTETYHEYILKFSMSGYTNDLNNYMAIVREWDGPKYPMVDGYPVNDSEEACGLELYSYRG
jgi:hypothetical protein